jgi:ribose 5-phosphate isomerase B
MTLPISDDALTELVRRVVRRSLGQGPPSGLRPTPRGRVVAIGADHRGLELKESLKQDLSASGFEVTDVGVHAAQAADYPDIAEAVAGLVAEGRAWRGIVINGAGIGSCIAANKVPGVRAALCYNRQTAVNSREHNDANVLSLGAGLIDPGLAIEITRVWLETPFAGGRHAQRVEKIEALERRRALASPRVDR